MARMTALRPGQSPPPVSTPMRISLPPRWARLRRHVPLPESSTVGMTKRLQALPRRLPASRASFLGRAAYYPRRTAAYFYPGVSRESTVPRDRPRADRRPARCRLRRRQHLLDADGSITIVRHHRFAIERCTRGCGDRPDIARPGGHRYDRVHALRIRQGHGRERQERLHRELCHHLAACHDNECLARQTLGPCGRAHNHHPRRRDEAAYAGWPPALPLRQRYGCGPDERRWRGRHLARREGVGSRVGGLANRGSQRRGWLLADRSCQPTPGSRAALQGAARLLLG